MLVFGISLKDIRLPDFWDGNRFRTNKHLQNPPMKKKIVIKNVPLKKLKVPVLLRKIGKFR